MLQVEIDSGSGFCFGVTTAIRKAEEELSSHPSPLTSHPSPPIPHPSETLYCLGDIVHNSVECERLRQMGLITINHEQMAHLHGVKVLLRAHGEPPETYELARHNNIEIIDATCPVVLKLQKRIKEQYDESSRLSPSSPTLQLPRLSSLARRAMLRCSAWWGRRRERPSSSRVSTT